MVYSENENQEGTHMQRNKFTKGEDSYNSGKGMTREQAKMSAVVELYVFRILFDYLHLLKNGKLNMSPRMKIVNGILIFVKL